MGDSPQTVNYGTDGTPVEAVPDPGCLFLQWSDGVTANPRTDTNVTTNISVTAQFEPPAPTPLPTPGWALALIAGALASIGLGILLRPLRENPKPSSG